MKDFIILMVKGMADSSIAGFDHSAINIQNQKLHFTGGNDIYHQENHPNSLHTTGNGVDFILKGSSTDDKLDNMLTYLTKLQETRYPNLVIKDEYRWPSEPGLFPHLHKRNEHTTGAHIHLQLT